MGIHKPLLKYMVQRHYIKQNWKRQAKGTRGKATWTLTPTTEGNPLFQPIVWLEQMPWQWVGCVMISRIAAFWNQNHIKHTSSHTWSLFKDSLELSVGKTSWSTFKWSGWWENPAFTGKTRPFYRTHHVFLSLSATVTLHVQCLHDRDKRF